MTINARYHQKLIELINTIEPDLALSALASTPLPDELVELIWQFAEDDLSPTEETRFCDLIAQHPAGINYLKAVALSTEALDASLDTLPSNVLSRLRAADRTIAASPAAVIASIQTGVAKLTEQAKSWQAFIADMSLEIAQDFLRVLPGTSVTPGFATARSATEPNTSHVQQLLKRIGIVELTIDHMGAGLCDLTIRIIEASDNHPLDSLSVLLKTATTNDPDPQFFVERVLRFRHLAVGDYAIVFQRADQEVDRLHISLRPAPNQ